MQGPRLLFIFIAIVAMISMATPGVMAVSNGSAGEDSFAPLDPPIIAHVDVTPQWVDDIINTIKDLPGAIWEFIQTKGIETLEWLEGVVLGAIQGMEDAVTQPFEDLALFTGPLAGSASIILAWLYFLSILFTIRLWVALNDIVPYIL
jgi:hypothetical protein